MRAMAADGVRVQTCITSPPYFGLRDYGQDGQFGLEETPGQYIACMVEVFRCVRDVLADDGTLWLNIGDSYSNIGKSGGYTGGICAKGLHGEASKDCGNRSLDRSKALEAAGLKPKDLIGIPWMLAFALRADGWYLRQEIIWHKPNPMPESVADRCTKAHESIFLLAKSERYFFDAAAISEPCAPESVERYRYAFGGAKTEALIEANRDGIGQRTRVAGEREYRAARNRRSVWTIPTKPYNGAHFAVFPPALVEPCVLAGSRIADTVIDPFFGSGTTGQVAQHLGRHFIGCELNRNYEALQQRRTAQRAFMFGATEQ
jgi:DNA modification methylase